MPEELNDSVPPVEPTVESQPAESLPAEQTPAEPQEVVTPEVPEEPTIPLSAHKRILENARKGAQMAEEPKNPPASSDNTDLGVAPEAAKVIETIANRNVQNQLADMKDSIRQEVTSEIQFEKEIESLKAKYNGADGLPKFDINKAMEHGKTKGIYNLESAYLDMTYDKRLELERKNIANELAKNPPVASERPGSNGAASSAPEERPKVDVRSKRSVVDFIRNARREVDAEQA